MTFICSYCFVLFRECVSIYFYSKIHSAITQHQFYWIPKSHPAKVHHNRRFIWMQKVKNVAHTIRYHFVVTVMHQLIIDGMNNNMMKMKNTNNKINHHHHQTPHTKPKRNCISISIQMIHITIIWIRRTHLAVNNKEMWCM